jgi:hypothetical protein
MWTALNEQLVPHPGERGRDREAVVRDFLGQYLPDRVGVSTGFVFDCQGGISQQADVVIYDRLHSPTFPSSGGTRFFPCESVLCVGQVKSNLNSRAELASALENIKSVKALDRSAGGTNQDSTSGRMIVPAENHLDQIFGFVFAAKSDLSSPTIREVFEASVAKSQRHLWPNLIFAFDRCLLTFGCPDGVCPNPMHALGIAEIVDSPPADLLLSFFLKIAMAVQVTSLGGFAYADYLWDDAPTAGNVFQLRPGTMPVASDRQSRSRRKTPNDR